MTYQFPASNFFRKISPLLSEEQNQQIKKFLRKNNHLIVAVFMQKLFKCSDVHYNDMVKWCYRSKNILALCQ